jgi:hypothetical protein
VEPKNQKKYYQKIYDLKLSTNQYNEIIDNPIKIAFANKFTHYYIFEFLKYAGTYFGHVDNNNQTFLIWLTLQSIYSQNNPNKFSNYLFDFVFETVITSGYSRPDIVDKYGNNALIYLCQSDYITVDNLLLLLNTNQSHPEIIDTDGNSIIMILLKYENKKKEQMLDLFTALVNTGKINFEQRNKIGETIFDLIAKKDKKSVYLNILMKQEYKNRFSALQMYNIDLPYEQQIYYELMLLIHKYTNKLI